MYEILKVDDRIRDLILANVPSSRIKREAMAGGMKTLREDGLHKVAGGLTTIEEVLRVTQEETGE
jgi:general secretion pathway protein E